MTPDRRPTEELEREWDDVCQCGMIGVEGKRIAYALIAALKAERDTLAQKNHGLEQWIEGARLDIEGLAAERDELKAAVEKAKSERDVSFEIEGEMIDNARTWMNKYEALKAERDEWKWRSNGEWVELQTLRARIEASPKVFLHWLGDERRYCKATTVEEEMNRWWMEPDDEVHEACILPVDDKEPIAIRESQNEQLTVAENKECVPCGEPTDGAALCPACRERIEKKQLAKKLFPPLMEDE